MTTAHEQNLRLAAEANEESEYDPDRVVAQLTEDTETFVANLPKTEEELAANQASITRAGKALIDRVEAALCLLDEDQEREYENLSGLIEDIQAECR